MKELRVENLLKTYGIKSLLDQVDFSIRTGDRVGLIGANGAGKSSFLKILSGEDPYDSCLLYTSDAADDCCRV